jgi:enoyl-CoA hydratase/carnithine racemase
MQLERRMNDGALVLTIQRPEAKNAINRALAEQLHQSIVEAGEDERVRAVVLTAAGADVFVAGGDLKEFRELDMDVEGAQQIVDMGVAMDCIESCAVPVIAAITGDVLGGGCELLVLCDLAIMEEHAAIEFRHATMGLTPAWGGTTRLAERVGTMRAADLLLSARRVNATEALQLGLVSQVVPSGQAKTAALALTAQIARSSRGAVAAIKRSLLVSRRARRANALDQEHEIFRQAWGSASHLEAMSAFLKGG